MAAQSVRSDEIEELVNAFVLFEEDEEKLEDSSSTDASQQPFTRDTTTFALTEEIMSEVLGAVSSDPILALAGLGTFFTKPINIKCLTEKLAPLFKSIIHTRNIFSAASREKSWNEYHKHHHQLMSIISGFIDNPQISSFILLKTMKALLSHPEHEDQAQDLAQLSAEELDILIYVGGFILFHVRKRFRHNLDCNAVVDKLINSGEKVTCKLICAKTRGGLVEPSDGAVMIFKICELEYRKHFSSFKDNSQQLFTSSLCENDSVTSLFYKLTSSTDGSIEAQEKVFMYTLEVFFRLRCHAKCRQFMEMNLVKRNSTKKQKALRKTISQNNHDN